VLQVDEEPGIRTNTTILLGNIANYMNDGVRLKNITVIFCLYSLLVFASILCVIIGMLNSNVMEIN
jgi:hypothetical protein